MISKINIELSEGVKENGVYFGENIVYSYYINERPIYMQPVIEDVTKGINGIETSIFQKIWDLYYIELIVSNESLISDILRMLNSKNVVFAYFNGTNSLTADTTKNDFFNINVENIEDTTTKKINIQFRVLNSIVEFFKGTKSGFILTLNNIGIRNGLFSDIFNFENYFSAKFKNYDLQFDIFNDINDFDKDSFNPNFKKTTTRITFKNGINTIYLTNRIEKSEIIKYLNSVNNAKIQNTKSNMVDIGYIATAYPNNHIILTSTYNFFEGQIIKLSNTGINYEIITTIIEKISDTEYVVSDVLTEQDTFNILVYDTINLIEVSAISTNIDVDYFAIIIESKTEVETYYNLT